jgi:hypothetical protein
VRGESELFNMAFTWPLEEWHRIRTENGPSISRTRDYFRPARLGLISSKAIGSHMDFELDPAITLRSSPFNVPVAPRGQTMLEAFK